MVEFDLNLYAILGAAVAAFALGAFWYSPLGFGGVWMRLMGYTEESMKSMTMTPLRAMAIGFITTLLASYVLAHFVAVWKEAAFGTMTLVDGLTLGFWVWLGFQMTIQIGAVLWENRPWKLFFLNAAYQLLVVLLMSAILTYFS